MSMSAAEMAALSKMYNSAGTLKQKEIENQYKLGSSQLKNAMKIAQMESGDRRANIEAQRDATRQQIEQARLEMERIGIPEVEIKRYVAEKTYEVAQNELALKRDIFLAESGLARDQLNKDIREMEEIGIPRMQIEKYAAEKQAELGELEYGLKRDTFVEQQRQFGINDAEAKRQYDTTHAEEARQFNVTAREQQRQFTTTASGYMDTGPALAPEQQARMQSLQDRQAVGAALSPEEQAELQGYQQAAAGGGPRQATLEREQFQQTQLEQARRYGLDVAQFGAQLASTPDSYFQARRFQGVDVPRLMGGAGAATQDVQGGPTPGVATMGAYLSGQDPFASPYGGPQSLGTASGGGPMATPYGGPTAGAPRASTPGMLGLPGTPEDDRYKQIQQIAKTVPPSPYDGLNESDSASLKLMESIYKKGFHQIQGGELERLQSSGRMGFLKSAGKMLGYSPEEEIARYQSYRPSQGSASLA